MSYNISLYKVGGCIRDQILGIKSSDIDFVVVISDDKIDNRTDHMTEKLTISQGFDIMTSYLQANNYKIFLSIPNMLTIRAKFPSNHMYSNLCADFILAKKESYDESDSDFIRTPIIELGTLADDLIRRDFTINAMAEIVNGSDERQIIDMFKGKDDLDKRILTTPYGYMSGNSFQTMSDDPLRVIRGLRFMIKYDMTPDENCYEAMLDRMIIKKLFKVVSSERIREELTKMFKFSTVKTFKILGEFSDKIGNLSDYPDHHISFIDMLFNHNTKLWLKPTTEI
jgi:tRNA nucleotidyltransferase/poly(A) polymerase